MHKGPNPIISNYISVNFTKSWEFENEKNTARPNAILGATWSSMQHAFSNRKGFREKKAILAVRHETFINAILRLKHACKTQQLFCCRTPDSERDLILMTGSHRVWP